MSPLLFHYEVTEQINEKRELNMDLRYLVDIFTEYDIISKQSKCKITTYQRIVSIPRYTTGRW